MERTNLIATGNTAEIYLVDGNIVKIYTDANADDVAREANNQSIAASLGLPVPRVIKVTEIDGKPALVMEHVPGRTMFDVIGGDWQIFAEYLPVSVELQRQVHVVVAPELRPMSERLSRQIGVARGLMENQKSPLLTMLADLGEESHLCHGDFHIQNLILNETGVTIIDWMDASRGDIRLDVCRSYLLYSMVSVDAAEMYLQEYCSQSGLSRNEVLRWLPVVAGARLSERVGKTEERRLVGIVSV